MPSLCEEAAHHYRFTQLDLRRWHEVRAALIGFRPSDRLRALVDHAIAVVGAEHRAAERRLFDAFDVITSNLLDVGPRLLSPKQYRGRLLDRARFHDNLAVRSEEPGHADMHHRLAEQLREVAASVEIPAPAPSRPRRARL